MVLHNLVLNSGYKLFDKTGNIIKEASTNLQPTCEGEWSITSDNKKALGPVRSLWSGFLTFNFNIVDSGYTKRMSNGATTGLGSGLLRINHHRGSSFSSKTNVKTICETAPFLTEDENHNPIIQTVLSLSGTVDGSGKSIMEVAIGEGSYSRDQVADNIEPAFTLNNLDQFKITYTLRFPVSSSAALTQNFFYNWLGTALSSSYLFTKITGETTANNPYEYSYNDASLSAGKNCIQANAGVVDKGIVLGTSDDAVAWSDYNLHGPLTADQLYPSATAASDCVYYSGSDTNGRITCARSFTNVSQEAITVREAGVISKVTHTNATASPGSFLMARWLLPEPVTVQPEETVRVYWQPTIVA